MRTIILTFLLFSAAPARADRPRVHQSDGFRSCPPGGGSVQIDFQPALDLLNDVQHSMRLLEAVGRDIQNQHEAIRTLIRTVVSRRSPSLGFVISVLGDDRLRFAGPLLRFSYTGFEGITVHLGGGGDLTSAAARLGAGIDWHPGEGWLGAGAEFIGLWPHALGDPSDERRSYFLAAVGPRGHWLLGDQFATWAVRAGANLVAGVERTDHATFFIGWEGFASAELRF